METCALVIGGAGAVGWPVVSSLLAQGSHVFFLDDLTSGFVANLP